jgi:hypothetical protein
MGLSRYSHRNAVGATGPAFSAEAAGIAIKTDMRARAARPTLRRVLRLKPGDAVIGNLLRIVSFLIITGSPEGQSGMPDARSTALTVRRCRAYHEPAMGRILLAFLCLFLISPYRLGSGTSVDSAGRSSLPTLIQVAPAGTEQQMMSRLLAQAAGYCARLSRASIDFVCLEEVSETIIEQQPYVRPSPHGRPVWQDEVVGHKYLYDYQFIVEFDGIKQKAEDTELDTRTFFYKNVLFGAVDLLAESRQSFYRYELKGRESQAGQTVAVIEAVPAPGLAVDVNRGTVWIRESDAAILKIVWNVTSMENSAAVRKTAKELQGTPQILQITEFGLEKNGIRFPNRFRIEEAYIGKNGKKRLRSVLDAVYRDYKFFTVAVDAPVIKQP